MPAAYTQSGYSDAGVKMINDRSSRILAFAGLALCGIASGQTPPGAGALQQQLDSERRPVLPGNPVPASKPEPSRLKATGASVTVTAFRFSGNVLLNNEQLAAVVQPYLNRPLDFAELQRAASAVAEAYRAAGWVVRAYLPAQEMTSGVVTIHVVEAVFGKVRREGIDPSRIRPDYLLELITTQQKQGEPVNAMAIDRALLLANDLPGVAAYGVLGEGASDRETDLVLRLAEEPLAIGEVSVDNYGFRSTGRGRLSGNLNLNSFFGRGDLITAHFVHTEGSEYLRLAATTPIGADGWRVGVNGSHLRYRLVADEFLPLDARGTANVLGVDATYPVIRSRAKNLYFSANLDHKSFDNLAGGVANSRYGSDVFAIGLSGNLFDNIGGGGANGASLAFVQGRMNLDGSPNQAADEAGARTAGRFNKIRYSANRQQAITGELAAYVALSGQQAGKNLDSSEKFYLGGPSGVRAYPTGEGGGSSGQLLNLELRWRFAEHFILTGFYDYGRITVNSNNGFAGGADPNAYSLSGAGLALAWQYGNSSVRATWARRIGENPNPTVTGKDQDGSLLRDRWWLFAALRF